MWIVTYPVLLVVGGTITRVTPEDKVSIFVTGFESANGSDFDSEGNLFVADYQGNAIRKIAPDGTFSTFADNLAGPAGVYVDPKNNEIVELFGANFSGNATTVLKITPDGDISHFAEGNGLEDVIGIAGEGKRKSFCWKLEYREPGMGFSEKSRTYL